MPYQKLVTVYSARERRMLHAQGIWIDRDGNQLPVREMGYFRIEKLAKTLATWAMKEPNSLEYLQHQPIFIHVLLRIRDVGLPSFYVDLFEKAYRYSLQENKSWQR